MAFFSTSFAFLPTNILIQLEILSLTQEIKQPFRMEELSCQARVVKVTTVERRLTWLRKCNNTLMRPKRNSAWFKEKMLLTEALESGAYLDPKQLDFLADNEDTFTLVQVTQEIPSPTAFQTEYLDAFNSNCDECPVDTCHQIQVMTAKLTCILTFVV
ncbi:hypothetical protein Tco_0241039 [Tanacetum coccineum]